MSAWARLRCRWASRVRQATKSLATSSRSPRWPRRITKRSSKRHATLPNWSAWVSNCRMRLHDSRFNVTTDSGVKYAGQYEYQSTSDFAGRRPHGGHRAQSGSELLRDHATAKCNAGHRGPPHTPDTGNQPHADFWTD